MTAPRHRLATSIVPPSDTPVFSLNLGFSIPASDFSLLQYTTLLSIEPNCSNLPKIGWTSPLNVILKFYSTLALWNPPQFTPFSH